MLFGIVLGSIQVGFKYIFRIVMTDLRLLSGLFCFDYIFGFLSKLYSLLRFQSTASDTANYRESV